MSQVISIIHDKGGVGKTTTCLNLGTALWLLGKKVLFIDTDKQCNLTSTLDKTAFETEDGTVYEWMRKQLDAAPIYTRYEGMDYIPGSKNMASIEAELFPAISRERRLSALLKVVDPDLGMPVREAYDYIIIDCAPGTSSMMNINVMAASDSVIVPLLPETWSLEGIAAVRRAVEMIHNDLDVPVKVLGYLLTRYNGGKRLSRDCREACKDESVTGAPLFPTPIRECVRCSEGVAEEMSLFEYAPESTAADDYMRMAEYICGIKVRKKTFTPSVWGKTTREAHNAFITNR